MAGKQLSYDYVNVKRDLSDAFEIIVKSIPVVSALMGAPLIGLDGAPIVAKATKHEWLEDSVSPLTFTVNGTRAPAGGTLVLVSTTGVKVGMVLGFTSATGGTKTVQLVVDTVTSGTDLAVSVYAGSTDVQLVATDIAKLISLPKNESTDPDPDSGSEPTTKFNYTQIFDRTAKVSKTSEAIRLYGIESALNYQVNFHLRQLAYDINNTMIYGRKVVRSAGVPGSMDGILAILEAQSDNQVDASAADVSPSIINDAFEQGFANGATGMRTLLCAENQARKISAFNTSGNNPVVQRDEKVAGSFVTTFVGDLPIGENGQISKIVVDPSFPKDKIVLLETEKIGLVPLQDRGFTDENAATNGADYFARRVLGEFTLQLRNANESHMEITNLGL